MYAAGREHPLRQPALQAVASIGGGTLAAATDVEVLQEILYRYLSLNQREFGFAIFDEFSELMRGKVLPLDVDEVARARALGAEFPRLEPRDLIHLAVMESNGIEEILSADRHFDGIPGIRRLPLESFA